MKRFFFSFFLIILALSSNGQSMQELRAKKNDAEKAVKYTATLLEESRKHERASLNKLKLIRSQIENRNSFIESVNSEIALLNFYISENYEVIGMLQDDLNRLKKEYAGMVRFAQKTSNNYDPVIFILSSEDINQAYKRLLYLRKYTSYRQNEAAVISSMSSLISKKLVDLEKQKQAKAKLAETKKKENYSLEQEKLEQNRYILILQKKQRNLKIKLEEQEKIQEELERAIEKLIREEAGSASNKEDYGLTKEEKLVAADFEKNKGHLPWPVEHGIITEHFGIHAHPVLKQLRVKNNGIDITTQKGAVARAVFNGKVSRIFAVSGGNMAVIIRHGSFLSVYSNLKDVFVKAGQKVILRQAIGSIYTDTDENKTVLKFQIWQENQKQDPESWISR